MTKEGCDVCAERQLIEMVQIFVRCLPTDGRAQPFLNQYRRKRFHTLKDVCKGLRFSHGKRQTAITNHNRCNAVTNGFKKRRGNFQFKIVMGVNIYETGRK